MSRRKMNPLPDILARLDIPPQFSVSSESVSDDQTLIQRTQWVSEARLALREVRETLALQPDAVAADDVHARAVANIARLRDSTWSSNLEIAQDASDILASLPRPRLETIRLVLVEHVKPLFAQTTPHPHLNLETGRKLHRPAGGKEAALDFYDDQQWKGPGVSEILLWCVASIRVDEWEMLWPLVIPPVMTLIDDYQPRHKLQGISVVQAMLKTVPASLLKRTGIQDLLFNSLNSALRYLNDPFSPDIIRQAVPTLISLVLLACPADSKERYDRVFQLVGEGIIGGIWLYSSRDLPSVHASIDTLPVIFEALGIATVRYVKDLIPQLLHPLKPQPFRPPILDLQLSALKALLTLIRVCDVRIQSWTGAIVDGVARCWVDTFDQEMTVDTPRLRQAIRAVTQKLAQVCPSVTGNEYARLLALDGTIFRELTRV